MSETLALLRGVNVGGNNRVPMGELRNAMEAAGFDDVRTYIASGNVMYKASGKIDAQAKKLRGLIKKEFDVDPEIVTYTARRWCRVVEDAPDWWGRDDDWRHNVFVVIPPLTPKKAIAGIGDLRDDIESVELGDGVLYQSIAISGINRGSTSSKIVGTEIYKGLTIRNHNTAIKLAKLLGTDPDVQEISR